MKRQRQIDFSFGEDNETDSVDDFVGLKRPQPKRRPTVSLPAIEGYVLVARQLAASGDWDGANPARVGELLVALYIVCHEKVYGVRPAEITSIVFPQAASLARKLHFDEFKGDVHAVVQYVRWAWTREIKKERWRRENMPESTTRIGWRIQFTSSYLLTDYRIAQARERSVGR